MPSTTHTDHARISGVKTTTNYSTVTGMSASVVNFVVTNFFPRTYKSKTWVRTPGYRALVANKGILPDNKFSFYRYTVSGDAASASLPSYRTANGWSQTTYSWRGPVGAFPVADTFAEDLNALKFALIAKAKGNQWNVPIFIGEGRKTVGLVVDTATRLVLMARALRRGELDQFISLAHPSARARLNSRHIRRRFGKDFAQDAKEAAASYWLQFKYGWVPMMLDLRSAMNTLQDTVEEPDARISRVTARVSSTITDISKEQTFHVDEPVYVYGITRRSLTCSQKGVWKFSVNAADVPGRFGLLNPLEVAWELVPLSFVADWFLPIGDYLSALDVPMRFTHWGGTYGKKISLMADNIPTRIAPVGTTFTGFRSTVSSVRVQRTPMDGAPSPSLLEMKFSPDLGSGRAVSAIALLQTFFGNKR